MPIRVPVDRFTPNRSQRRIWRRNQDLLVDVGAPDPTEEKFDLYRRYLRERHQRGGDNPDADADADDRAAFVSFLYDSPVHTIEFTYRDPAGSLLGVGICDVSDRSLSSVYFYFDPAASKRGLGTFSSLLEIDFSRRKSIPYYYLGYWIEGCDTMHYKSQYQPHELLHPDGQWRESRGARTVENLT